MNIILAVTPNLANVWKYTKKQPAVRIIPMTLRNIEWHRHVGQRVRGLWWIDELDCTVQYCTMMQLICTLSRVLHVRLLLYCMEKYIYTTLSQSCHTKGRWNERSTQQLSPVVSCTVASRTTHLLVRTRKTEGWKTSVCRSSRFLAAPSW